MRQYLTSWFTSALVTSESDSARLKTQDGSTAFDEGRAYRLPFEYSVSGTPAVLRFTSPVSFCLTEQLLSCDVGNIRLDAYRAATESGAWTDVQAFSRNLVAGMARQVTISTGGTITPTSPSVDKIRVRTAGAAGQRSTGSQPLRNRRRLAAGTYYLVLSRIDGGDTATGIYLIEWEEGKE
jgi:hypothetical protein